MKVTKEEAARLASRYLYLYNGIKYKTEHSGEWTSNISIKTLLDIEEGYIKSFQLQLRSIDEMTEVEKAEYEYISNTNEGMAPDIDYLDKIGVDTRNYKGVTFKII